MHSPSLKDKKVKDVCLGHIFSKFYANLVSLDISPKCLKSANFAQNQSKKY